MPNGPYDILIYRTWRGEFLPPIPVAVADGRLTFADSRTAPPTTATPSTSATTWRSASPRATRSRDPPGDAPSTSSGSLIRVGAMPGVIDAPNVRHRVRERRSDPKQQQPGRRVAGPGLLFPLG